MHTLTVPAGVKGNLSHLPNIRALPRLSPNSLLGNRFSLFIRSLGTDRCLIKFELLRRHLVCEKLVNPMSFISSFLFTTSVNSPNQDSSDY